MHAPSVGVRVGRRLDGEEAAGRAFQAFRADPRHKYANVEREVNSYGYRLIGEKRIDDAVAILESDD